MKTLYRESYTRVKYSITIKSKLTHDNLIYSYRTAPTELSKLGRFEDTVFDVFTFQEISDGTELSLKRSWEDLGESKGERIFVLSNFVLSANRSSFLGR